MIYFALIVLGIATRLLPHPPNFTGVAATALFAGYYIKNKKWAVILPLIIMFLSDLKLGFYQWQIMASVYLSFILVSLLGIVISKKHWIWAFPASIAGTVIFYLITNWAVWQFGTWYPRTMKGLLDCYLAGLPFIKINFVGDLTYTLGLFGGLEVALTLAKKIHPQLAFLLKKGN